ncbi:MAG TPA: phosphatase PAP2 family protein [Chthoniobacterales bacterium]|nr:phosphatase PAP2 family protein [Chthoniobacterales bacterium]
MKHKREFRPARWLVTLAAAGALMLGCFYLDDAARSWITEHQGPGPRIFMQAVSRYGDWPEHVALGLIMLAVAWSRGSKPWMRIFAAMIVACALAGIGARVVKIATGRARPNVQVESGWNGPRLSARYNAFPSGHTAASTAFFATLVFAGWRIGAPLLLIPMLIAFSRMYVAAHYLSDVVFAALVGLLVAYLVARRTPSIENRKLKIEN